MTKNKLKTKLDVVLASSVNYTKLLNLAFSTFDRTKTLGSLSCLLNLIFKCYIISKWSLSNPH